MGKVVQIVQAGGAGLPAWLHFDDVAWTFVGVPSEPDVGHHYLLVTATGPAGDQAKDVFDVEVTQTDQELHAAPMDSGAPCEPGDAASVLTVVLDADLHAMAPRERVAVVERVQQYVNVARDRVRLRAVADDQKLFDSAAVMAGPGNARKPAHGGVFVSWQVGCGKNPSVYSIPGLSHIEVSSQDGRLADHIGYPVIGWHVASRKVTQGKRLRRQVWLQATATAGVAVPTPATPYTTRTMTDREPMTSRVIPSMASPGVMRLDPDFG
ncbi:PREDICTED: dystroglycan-like [Priapulus caudatus]|uniref:Dystroglycan-like n=1 Tax=Priapulus caudatus TaxID=37621 RepID=A0ABM1F2S3_PRICU|nr:PREDICTED: dystroglycan-like [Priapulus caudatus]